MRTSELTGPALDWAVAKCRGIPVEDVDFNLRFMDAWKYSTDWSQGGSIIEREKITVSPFYNEWVAASSVGELVHDSDGDCMTIAMWESEPHFYGPTPLIAAMRCYVASKLGATVAIPKELL